MKKTTCFILSLLCFSSLLLLPQAEAQTIYLSEASNANTLLQDEDEDAPDWLEIHHPGPDTVNLVGWTLSDDPSDLGKWTCPAYRLPPNAYLQIWASGKDRKNLLSYHSLINKRDEFSYLTPSQPVSDEWIAPDFDDSGWETGYAGFGFGDNDDFTTVPQTAQSVFLRKKFSVADTNMLRELLLDVDVDDGFLAYLNGQLFARYNLDGDAPVPYDTRATESREIQSKWGRPLLRWSVESFQQWLREGENVLCLQVHNHQPGDGDLSLIPYLTSSFARTADNGDRLPPSLLRLRNERWHTNFRIRGAGETIYLTSPDGSYTDSLRLPALGANTSIGKSFATEAQYFQRPTPGAANTNQGTQALLEQAVVFYHQGGLTEPFALVLSGADADRGQYIGYTLDATEPHQDSPRYDGPLSISENTVVRAAVFQADYLTTTSQTRSYLFDSASDLPVVAMVTEPRNLFNPDYGIYVLGNRPGPHNNPFFGTNIWEDWERPAHFSFYPNGSELGVALNGGVKIFGAWSRARPQRSLSFFARSAYGHDALQYPLFPNRPYPEYQSIVLRNSGNDFNRTMLRDAMMTGLFKDADLEIQAYQPVRTYLNGQYWGMYNLREKVNEHFLAAKFDLSPDDINLLGVIDGPIHGSDSSYQELLAYVATNAPLAAEGYDYLAQRIDIDNLMLYYLAQVYIGNTDWPHNNKKYWQPRGGKWRWILFDTDFGFNVSGGNTQRDNHLSRVLHPSRKDNVPFLQALMPLENFRHRFINRFADEMNSRLLPERVNAHIDSLSDNITMELARHFDRWGGNAGAYPDRINQYREFADERPELMKEHIKQQFGLPAHHALSIDNPTPEQGFVRVNTLSITSLVWQGDYFATVPVPVTAQARHGYAFSHWELGSNSTSARLDVELTAALSLRPVFQPQMVNDPVINEINYNSSDDFNSDDWIELHNPTSETIDLTAWVVKDEDDSHEFLFPEGTSIEPNGFIIVAREREIFLSLFPEVENVFGDLGFGLSGGSDEVRLFDPSGNLRDSVAYDDEAPWPEAADGTGATLELIDPELDNVLPSSWGIRNPDGGSPGRPNWPVNTGNRSNEKVRITLLPNPFTDFATVEIALARPMSINIELIDLTGKRVRLLYQGRPTGKSFRLTNNLNSLPQGFYLLRLTGENGTVTTKRWIKQ